MSKPRARRTTGCAKPRGPRLALALASTVLVGTLGSIFLWVPSVAADASSQCGGGGASVGLAGVDSEGEHPVACAAAAAAAADAPLSRSAPAADADGKAATYRLVAVPDLHGDLKHARASLRLAGALSGYERGGVAWGGGANTHLVQTGDILDRGEDSIAILNLLAELTEQAEAVGGSVTALLGNHELMTLEGQLNYVARGKAPHTCVYTKLTFIRATRRSHGELQII